VQHLFEQLFVLGVRRQGRHFRVGLRVVADHIAVAQLAHGRGAE